MTAMKPGTEAMVDSSCGVQFALCPLRVRLMKVLDHVTLGPDLVWVQVYELDRSRNATRSRELLVIRDAFEAACATGIARRSARQPTPEKEVSHVGA